MTLLFAGIACCTAVVLAAFSAQLAVAASDSARAQLAADAAALAAVAEAGPYGRGDPRGQAESFAAANGARLVRCDCPPGAMEVRVTVAVGDSLRTARAVIDPARFKVALPWGGPGLHPALERAVQRLVEEAKGRVRVVSGYRAPEQQAALWDDALRRYGDAEAADDWVAPPGTSMHERGLAVDLGGDLELAVRLVRALGLPLHRPLANEPWHFELARDDH